MKHLFLYFSFLLFLTCQAQIPSFTWAKKYSGYSTQYGALIKSDALGNVYTVISFDGTTDFDPGPGTYTLQPSGNYGIGICKLSSAGTLLWAKEISGGTSVSPTGLALDLLNNVYISGYFNGGIDFNPGTGTAFCVSGADDPFIVKLRSNGDFAWVKQFAGQAFESCNAITIDANYNVLTTGTFQWIADFDPGPGTYTLMPISYADAFISKLDSSGNFVWAKQFVGQDDVEGLCITTDAANNIYSAGRFFNTVDLDPGPGVYMLGDSLYYMYVSKLDASGNFVFAKKLDAYPNKLVLDGSGNIIIGGYFVDISDFDPGPLTYSLSTPGSDYFILKLDPLGNFQWVKASGSISNAYVSSVSVDLQDNIYAAGTFFGTMDLDPGPGSFTMNAGSNGGGDVFLSCLNPSGNFIWGGEIGGSFPENSADITLDKTGNIYAIGRFMSDTCDLNPMAGTYTLTNSGMYDSDAFVVKLSYCIASTPGNPFLTVCSGKSTTLNVSGAGNISWYASAVSTATLATGNSLTSPPTLPAGTYTFYAESGNCQQIFERTPVVVTVNPLPQPSALSSSNLLCVDETATLSLNGAASFMINGISSSQVFTISPPATTQYTLTGAFATGCTNTAVFTQSVGACLGITDLQSSTLDITVYPNPGSGDIKISGIKAHGLVAELYNLLGESLGKVIVEDTGEIHFSFLPKGTYILKLSQNGQRVKTQVYVKEDL